MPKLWTLSLLVLALGAGRCLAEQVWPEMFSGNIPWPDNAKVSLSTDREDFFLGENVLIHFTMENAGGSTFQAAFGGDYRAAPRALRFHVTAADEMGNQVADPYPHSRWYGGFGGPEDVTPEKPFHESLSIMRYLRIEKPGTYVIRVQHASGWKGADANSLPVSTITLTFKRPTAEQARELVVRWLEEPRYSGVSSGEKGAAHPDFSQIREPVYLPALTEAAHAGDARGISGVGSIPTRAATRVLLDLVNSLEGESRRLAARELCGRLPDPRLTGVLDKRNFSEDDHNSYRIWLVEQAWDDSLADDVREVALRMLTDRDAKWVATGAFMLECVGTVDDSSHILAALDREIPRTTSLALRTDIFPRPNGACMELKRAARMMHLRGADIPTRPDSPGESLLFLIALSSDESFRPDGWISICNALLLGDVPYLQEQTLTSLPTPIPVELHPALSSVLATHHVDAARAACNVIGRDKLVEFKQPILQELRTAKEEWHFRAASDAAIALDADYERLAILVDRLNEEGMLFECVNGLKVAFDNVGGGGSNSNINVAAEAQRIKPLWQAFLSRHAEHFQAGGKLSLPHPDVTPEMFPQHFGMTLKTGGQWPTPSQ